jgi:3alpha(or 20beta)-hydroxysteroid dehydrogenase
MGRVDGKIAIVSGAGSGMGVAHVRALTAEGARVVGFDVKPGDGPGLVDELSTERFFFLTGDVTSKTDWAAVVAECESHFGAPSVLVNNAGVFRPNRVATVSEQEYRAIIDINQIGTYLGMQSVIAPMRSGGGGSIINICSTAGLVAFTDNFAYVASKWAVRGMTRAAALEHAADGIRVNNICPGETDTPMIRDSAGVDGVEAPEANPFGRWARPEEIAAGAVFLASDESSYMSGSDLVIDGAFTAT